MITLIKTKAGLVYLHGGTELDAYRAVVGDLTKTQEDLDAAIEDGDICVFGTEIRQGETHGHIEWL